MRLTFESVKVELIQSFEDLNRTVQGLGKEVVVGAAFVPFFLIV